MVYSVAEAVKLLGAEEQKVNGFSQIQDFYRSAGEGAELWLRLLPTDQTFEKVCEAGGPAESLLTQAKGAVRLLGLSHVELTGNKPTTAKNGIEGNIEDGVIQAQALSKRVADNNQPIHVIVAGHYVKTLADLTDYKEATNDRVSSAHFWYCHRQQICCAGTCLRYTRKIACAEKFGSREEWLLTHFSGYVHGWHIY